MTSFALKCILVTALNYLWDPTTIIMTAAVPCRGGLLAFSNGELWFIGIPPTAPPFWTSM